MSRISIKYLNFFQAEDLEAGPRDGASPRAWQPDLRPVDAAAAPDQRGPKGRHPRGGGAGHARHPPATQQHHHTHLLHHLNLAPLMP